MKLILSKFGDMIYVNPYAVYEYYKRKGVKIYVYQQINFNYDESYQIKRLSEDELKELKYDTKLHSYVSNKTKELANNNNLYFYNVSYQYSLVDYGDNLTYEDYHHIFFNRRYQNESNNMWLIDEYANDIKEFEYIWIYSFPSHYNHSHEIVIKYRTDERLFDIIKIEQELGLYSVLGIVEIPDDIEFEITQYDNCSDEIIVEIHRTWKLNEK